MTEKKPMMLFAGTYESVSAALADLDAIEQLHKDEMIGAVDAAVIDKEDGRPHIVKRVDRPRVRIVPDRFGGGTLPRMELHGLRTATVCHAPASVRAPADGGSLSRLRSGPRRCAR